jgi:hypothetical protein
MTTAPPDSIARSAALLEAARYTVLALVPPGLRSTWQLVACAASMPGVLLVAVLAERPNPTNPRLAMPAGFHPASRRLIHVWPADGALPAAVTL